MALVAAASPLLHATSIPRISFEQLTDASDVIASGRVTRSWTAWDSEHKYIWTHYTLSIAETVKGVHAATVEFAEPGGAVNGVTTTIAGSVRYAIGEDAVIFLSRMPNGYLRTTGWTQGKFSLDSTGRLHGVALQTEMPDLKTGGSGTSLRSLDGMTLGELKTRIAARVQATAGRVK